MRSAVWIVGALVIAIGIGVGAYAIGTDQAPTSQDAALAHHESARSARLIALHSARRRAFKIAFAQGIRLGDAAGKRAGRAAGGASGSSAASAQEAEIAEESEPAPGTPGSTVCVTYQDYVPGVGCVPPVAPGETEAPINCPAGQIPVGTTGACAPE